jgi:hypothetical protein
MKTSKEKLDEKLGIKDINDIFNQNDIDAILRDSKIEIDNIDSKIKNKSKEIDTRLSDSQPITNQLNTIQQDNNLLPLNKIYNLDESLLEISFLVNKSKDIITNLYKYITQTDFIDPDIISSTAKMIEASRIVIADYIELYKEKIKMIHAYNMEMQKHKNKLELEQHKAELKFKYATKDIETDKDTENVVPYVQEQIVKIINDSQK